MANTWRRENPEYGERTVRRNMDDIIEEWAGISNTRDYLNRLDEWEQEEDDYDDEGGYWD